MWTAVGLVVQEELFTSSGQTANVVTGKSITFELAAVKRNQEKVYLLSLDGQARVSGLVEIRSVEGPLSTAFCVFLILSRWAEVMDFEMKPEWPPTSYPLSESACEHAH